MYAYICIYIYCDLQPSCTTAAGGTLFAVTLLLSQQFCVNVPYDPHYGRPGADLRRKVRTRLNRPRARL